MTIATGQLTVSIDDWCGTPSGEYDADGVQWTVSKPTGWFDGPPSRTNFTDRPHADGSFDAPEYAGARVVTIDGRIGVDDPALLPKLEAARQRTQALLRYGKGTLRVDGRGESLQAQVRRSDMPTCDAVGGLAYDFSVQLTAPDPIRYGTATRRTAVDLGAPAPSGLNFGAGGKNLLANPTFDRGHDPWTVTGGSFYSGFGAGRTMAGGTIGHSVGIDPDTSSAQCVLLSEQIAVGTGTKVLAGIWVNLGESTTYSTSVNWYDSTGTALTPSANPVSVTGNSWTYVENTFTVPSGAVSMQLAATLQGTPQNRWYADDARLEMAEAAGLDFSGGLDFGGGAGQTLMYLDNPGTADVLPTFAFNRPVDQPVLTNPDNGGRLEYLGSVMAGQQLAIDCKRKTVLLNGISRRTVMGRSDFGAFAVPHEGVLRVAFGTLAQQLAGARVEAAWLEGWW